MREIIRPGLSNEARQALALKQLQAREQELAERLNEILPELNAAREAAALAVEQAARLLFARRRALAFCAVRDQWEGGLLG